LHLISLGSSASALGDWGRNPLIKLKRVLTLK